MNNQDKIHTLSRAVIIDQGKILLCKTLDLEKSFYFLPGGHIKNGESINDCLIRELKEETGAKCNIIRFLGCLEHSFKPGHRSICHNHEYNFIYEVESDDLKYNIPTIQLEEHIALMQIPLEELSKIDFRAEPLEKLIPQWLRQSNQNAFASKMYQSNSQQN